MHKRRCKEIAWRLASGDSREGIGHCLPTEIKLGLQDIARATGKSVSWVLEQVIVDYFNLERPRYKKPKRLTAKLEKVVPFKQAATHRRKQKVG